MIARARCVDCKSDVSLHYERDSKRSEAGLDPDSRPDINVSSDHEEVKVAFSAGSEPRTAYYELAGIDEVD